MKPLPRILLVWYYDRKDLFLPFEMMNDSFEYSLLFYKFKEDESNSLSYRTYYWAEFGSPYSLLETAKIDAVIFMGLESNYAIGLNIACKNLNVPTIHLEHGIRFDLQYYMQNEARIGIKKLKEQHKLRTAKNKKWHSLLFLFNSLKMRNMMSLFTLIRYVLYSQRQGIATAMNKVKFGLRLPDLYINFTKFNAQYICERDGILEDDIIEIGNPVWDRFFKKEAVRTADFYIHIDTPIVDAKNGLFEVTVEERNDFFMKLNSYCMNNNSKLLIKLHPDSYSSNTLPIDENITYLRDVDITEYTDKARGCFGFFSSLILPIAFKVPCLLFQFNESQFQNDLKKLGIINSLDFKHFDVTDIQFSKTEKNREMDSFVAKYLYKADGMANDRLREVLLKICYA